MKAVEMEGAAMVKLAICSTRLSLSFVHCRILQEKRRQ